MKMIAALLPALLSAALLAGCGQNAMAPGVQLTQATATEASRIAPSKTPIKVMKKAIPVAAVQLAAPETIQTLEGPVQGNAGDWVLTGVKGERWPVSPDKFAKTYEAVKGKVGFYAKKAIVVEAVTLDQVTQVKTSWGADLTGQPGDWLVTAAADDQWIVEKEIFNQTYKRVRK